MLSILIPIYNFDCRQLVADLDRQCQNCGIAYEIVVQDDDSTLHFQHLNKTINAISSQVKYIPATRNLGRAAIRNALAAKAQFDYLLFLDCDVKVVRADFIRTYVQAIIPETILVGGHVYQSFPPKNPELYLHWYYGLHREQSTLAKRLAKANQHFTSVNFLMPANVFQHIRFDTSLKQYGHEDTLFGLALAAQGVSIVQLNNPVEHLGIEPTEQFLQKNAQAIENLLYLTENGKNIETRLTKSYDLIIRLRLRWLGKLLFQLSKPYLEQQLRKRNFNLRWFDIWKLGMMCQLSDLKR